MNDWILLDHLSKSFDDKRVLNEFCAQIQTGRITLLMGPSGCGKTTLLRLVAGLERPDSGAVILPAASKIGMVFQEDRLCEGLGAVKNVALVCPRSVDRAKIAEHLLALGLTAEDLKKPVRTFSGGMKRRVAIVRAVLCGAPILLMDEPLKGLDAQTRQRAAQYIAANCANRTVLMVTHDPQDIARFENPPVLQMN